MKNRIIVGVVLSVLAFLLYANTISHDYNMDDDLVTQDHPRTAPGFKAIPQIFKSYYFENAIGNQYEYRPITHLSFAVEHQFFGQKPYVSHLINVLLYALTAFLLFATLRALWPNYSILLPALATAIFVAHPLHTEAVASIKNRDEILAFLGGISALYFAIRFVEKQKVWHYLLFVLLFVVGVLSKRSILSYVLLLPIALVWFRSVSITSLTLLGLPMAVLWYLFSPNANPVLNVTVVIGVLAVPIVLQWLFFSKEPPVVALKLIWSIITTRVRGQFVSEPEEAANDVKTRPAARLSLRMATPDMVLLFLGFSVSLLAVYFVLRDGRVAVLTAFIVVTVISMFARDLAGIILYLVLFLLGVFIAWVYQLPVAFLIALVPLMLSLARNSSAAAAVGIFGLLVSVPLRIISKGDLAAVIDGVGVASVGMLLGALCMSKPKLRPLLFVFLGLNVFKMAMDLQFIHLWWPGITIPVYFILQQRSKFVPLTRSVIAALVPVMLVVLYFNSLNYFYPENKFTKPKDTTAYEQIDGIREGTFVPGAGRVLDFVENPMVKEKSASARVGMSAKVMGYYVMLMAVPAKLNFYYGYDSISMVTLADVWPAALMLFFIAALVLALARAQKYPVLTFGVFYLVASLFLISNLGVLVAGIVAERLAYSAILGFAILLAWGILKIARVDMHTQTGPIIPKPLFWLAVLAVVAAFGTRTVIRNFDWKDKLTLYTRDAGGNSRSAKGIQLVGFENMRQASLHPNDQAKYFLEAEKAFRRAIGIYSNFHSAIYNLGYLEAYRGSCTKALPYLKKAAELEPFFPSGQFYYANCLEELGQLDSAALHYEKCLAQDPYYEFAYANLSFVYYKMGDLEKSIQTNKRAISYFPQSPEPYINIGKTYLAADNIPSALQYFEQAYPLATNDLDLVMTMANLYREVGNEERALFYQNKAQQIGGGR